MPWLWLLRGAVASSHALFLWLNSHLPLALMHHAASISFHPSCLALSSLVSSCLILPISCPCYPSLSPLHTPFLSPDPPLTASVSLSISPSPLHSAVEVSYDAAPESSPVFNYINKTPCEVEWPRTPQPSLHPPHTSPSLRSSLPVVLQARVYWGSLQAQPNRCQVAFHGWLRGMCFSVSSIGSTPQSPAVPDMLTSLEVMSETSPSLPDLL